MLDIFEANGARFLAEHDMIVAFCRRYECGFEPETSAFLFDALEDREGAFIDVGAATGWYAIAAALRGSEVHAFEPDPAVRTRFHENMALNGVQFDVHAAAASNTAGRASFFRNPRVPLTSGGSLEGPPCRAPRQFSVDTVTLDETLAGVAPALIKIDVEGHEIAVLDGARRLISEHRPYLVLEANTEAHADLIHRWLAEIGVYRTEFADTRNILCAPAS